MQISVIIPVYNEEKNIEILLKHLLLNADSRLLEIIVVDSESKDNTLAIAATYNVTTLISPARGRAAQMNYGAQHAKGNIFYFVHADTLPPATYTSCITSAVLAGIPAGCCAYNFNSDKALLKLNSFLTRYKFMLSGGGDQTLFVTRTLFEKAQGFNSEYVIMEDFELTRRLKKISTFKVLPSKALVSARKYEHNSYLRVSLVNLYAMLLFRFNVNPTKIKTRYSRMLNL